MEQNKKRYLVTGGAGFIGSHLCETLLNRGYAVRCLDNLSTGKKSNLDHIIDNPDMEFVKGDIRDKETCVRAAAGMDGIAHLAALGSVPRSIDDPMSTESTNLLGFVNMLEACRDLGVKRFVFASSSSVYGDETTMPKKEDRVGKPLSPYAVTKAMDEMYANLYHESFGLEVVGLRYFNVFGERQDPEGPYAAAIPKFIKRLIDHEPPKVNGKGDQTRDFTYVKNAANAATLGLIAEKDEVFGEVFNVACGDSCDLLSLINKLKDGLAEQDPEIRAIEPEHGPERAGDVPRSLADISKARYLLGYEPLFDLDAGLKRAIPWYWENWR